MGANTVGNRPCSCGGSASAASSAGASSASSSSATGGTQACQCSGDALAGGLARTRFFNGMLLTQTDLESEQRYWKMKRRLTNRALGRGVAWGLQTTFDEGLQTFSLSAGYGVDCCGNDLVVEARHEFGVPYLGDPAQPAVQQLLQEAASSPTGSTKAAVMLQFAEVPECPLPATATNGASSTPARYEYSRMRETTRVCLAPLPKPEYGIVTLLNELKKLVPGLQNIQGLDAGSDPTSQPYLWDTRGAAGGGARFPCGVIAYAGNGNTSQTLNAFPNAQQAYYQGNSEQTVWVSPVSQGTESSSGPGAWQVLKNTAVFDVLYQADSNGQASLPIQIELAPSGDLMFASGAVRGKDFSGADLPLLNIPGPVGGVQSWRMLWQAGSIPLPLGSAYGGLSTSGEQFSSNATVSSWVLGSLFNGGRYFDAGTTPIGVQTTVEIDRSPPATSSAPPSSPTLGVPFDSVRVTVTTTVTVPSGATHEQVYSPENTLSLVPFVSTRSGDPQVAIGSVTLMLLHAWLSDGLANSAVTTQPSGNSQEIAAKWLYLAVWQVLTGVDPTTAPNAGSSARLLDIVEKLFEHWCSSLMYAGPRCDETHGIVLGTAEFRGPSAQLARFSQWEGRRFVMTGALASHWLTHFGVAAPDQMAARFFDIMTRGAGSLKTTTSFADVDASKTLLAMGGAYYFYGTSDDAQRAVQGTLEYGPEKAVGFRELFTLVTELLGGGGSVRGGGSGGSRYSHYAFATASGAGQPPVGIHLFIQDGGA